MPTTLTSPEIKFTLPSTPDREHVRALARQMMAAQYAGPSILAREEIVHIDVPLEDVLHQAIHPRRGFPCTMLAMIELVEKTGVEPAEASRQIQTLHNRYLEEDFYS